MKRLLYLKVSLLIYLIMGANLLQINAQDAIEKTGLQLWSVRDEMAKDPVKTLNALGEMGYDFIEAAGYKDGTFYGMKPEEFKTVLKKANLMFVASHAGHPLPDKDTWDDAMAWWDKCIDAHLKAGANYLIQPSMDKKGYGSLADLKRYCDYFNAIGEKCNAKGIQFGYHNHDKEFGTVDDVVRYDYMLQNTDPEKVLFEIDVYWVMIGGKNAIDYFNNYPGRFALWHLKDEKELGESGKMDFEAMLKQAKVAGLKRLIIEVEHYNYTPMKSVEKSLTYLKQL